MQKQLIFLILVLSFFNVAEAQEGETTVSAGPLLSFPLDERNFSTQLNTGVGVEIIGQYNFSDRSSFILQTNWASYGTKPKEGMDTGTHSRKTIFSLRAGYRYQFGASGFFTNIQGGIEKYSDSDFNSSSIALGVGKRFLVKDSYYIDAGVDCVSRTTDVVFNLKVLFSFFRIRNE